MSLFGGFGRTSGMDAWKLKNAKRTQGAAEAGNRADA
jgi:hypothetical protein